MARALHQRAVMTLVSAGRLVLALVLGSSLAACGVGSTGPGGGGDVDAGFPVNPGDPERIPSGDPSHDERLDDLGIVCQSALTVTGTYTQGTAPPVGHTGCWADGTWNLTATIDFVGCDPQDELGGPFVYQITHVDDIDEVVFTNDPEDDRVNLKITTAGDNLCYGKFEHFSVDRRVLSLQPVLDPDGTLSGEGTFSVFAFDPF